MTTQKANRVAEIFTVN